MSGDEISTKIFTPALAMFERADITFRVQIDPPTEIRYAISTAGKKGVSKRFDNAIFEMKKDEFHVREDDDITIFKIVDQDTLKTPNAKHGAIPRWITLKREQ